MCGICGIVLRDGEPPVDAGVLRRMCELIEHRGPDEDGYHVAGGVGLGMRRLSIIDVEGGHQPVPNETGTVQTVCNGEIYNHQALRRELERAGHRFRSRSDVEVITHAYEEDADGFLSRLRGMFGLAVWDEDRRRLVLAVDRFGIKPLYFAETPRGVVFGSELKCLLASGLVGAELDPDGVAQYFTLGYIPAPTTVFRGVRKLEPGHALRWTQDGGARVERYWDLPHGPVRTDRPAQATRRELRAALRESVAAHLVSDVPLGAFLSGGIDSSAVVALMSEVVDEPVRTFSIGFGDPRYSELPKARLVAERFRTDHHELVVEPESVDLLPRLVGHFDEPFADASALPTYYVSKLAREHVKVALSGDGGDEVFLGYTIFRGLELARHAQRVPAAVRSGLSALPGLIPTTRNAAWNDRVATLRRRALDTVADPATAFRSKIASPGLEAASPFLSADLRDLAGRGRPYGPLDDALASAPDRNGRHPLARYVDAGLRVTLPGDMLVKVDRMSMANSLEVRVPLLDDVLLDFVATIPIEQRFPRWQLKGLFRATMADALPPEILDQRKQGFQVPLAAWFRGDLDGFALEVLRGEGARSRGMIDADAVERLVARHTSGRDDLSSTIWSLLMFELWCERYLG